jgi:oligoribonuclease
MKKQNNLIWIDTEMTGLNPETDVLLEVALVVTDDNLVPTSEGFSWVIYQTPDMLARMNDTVRALHTHSGLVAEVQKSTITIEEVERALIDHISVYCDRSEGILCGNSVWQDKLFLKRYMPRVIDYLHYRILDVTAFKVAIGRWYADDPRSIFPKKNAHRALDDIYESIEELRYYRRNFLLP